MKSVQENVRTPFCAIYIRRLQLPLIDPGCPQFRFVFHAPDYPPVGDTSEGGVQRTLTHSGLVQRIRYPNRPVYTRFTSEFLTVSGTNYFKWGTCLV
jgi:hypothetical protein